MDKPFILGRWLCHCSKCKKELSPDNFSIHTGNGKPRRQCKKCCYDKICEWDKKNPDKRKQYSINYRMKNYAKHLEFFNRWRRNNLKYDCYRQRTRKAIKLQRTPKWANLEKIKEFYKNCPKGYHVDHIVPLQGKTFSGFHVIENLQYLPAIENLKKRNLYVG